MEGRAVEYFDNEHGVFIVLDAIMSEVGIGTHM
jgi:hypothetical protein